MTQNRAHSGRPEITGSHDSQEAGLGVQLGPDRQFTVRPPAAYLFGHLFWETLEGTQLLTEEVLGREKVTP